jgi:hypothetical protein
MKIKNFLKLYLIVCNLLYSAVIDDLDFKLKKLSDEVILQLDPKYPNFEQIKRVLTEANKIQTLNIANLPQKQQEKIAETQIHLVSFLMELNLDQLITISKNETDNPLKLFLQDIYNNNQSISELYQKGLSFINDYLKKITDSSLEIFAKNLGINLVKTEKKSLEVQTQEEENALLKEKFKAILLLINQLNDDKTLKDDLLNTKFKSPQDFEERLPELLADRLVELISSQNIGNNRDWLTQKIVKDLTPNTIIGNLKQKFTDLTYEHLIGRRLQQFLLNLATKDNLGKYQGLIKQGLEVKARDILQDTNINKNEYLNFINPDKNHALKTRNDIESQIAAAIQNDRNIENRKNQKSTHEEAQISIISDASHRSRPTYNMKREASKASVMVGGFTGRN